jgi:L-asparaginase / beta-aspartyl-peptidase
MSRLITLLPCWLACTLPALGPAPARAAAPHPVAIAIHGGAGVMERAKMSAEREAAYRAGLTTALHAGYAILERGGSSLDAVAAVVRTLEDDPLFNAGRGAVLDARGDAELDAAIMDGNGPRAGAVAAVRHVKNPIDLARLVMDKTPYVLLVGDGAEEFALEQGVMLVSADYFRTERRIEELQEAQREHAAAAGGALPRGTVGAVAVDRAGNLAAATSTGGLTNKHTGRVGDSPLIGAGTYANNESCAVSGTGTGEYFIRGVVAYDVCALLQYRHLPLAQAVHAVIYDKLQKAAADTGGLIAIDRAGNIVMEFNTPGMLRAAHELNGRETVAIFREDQ